jgi:hypothetical protein
VDKVDDFVFIPVDKGLEVPGVTFPDRAHHIIIGENLVFFRHFIIITDFNLKSCEKTYFYFASGGQNPFCKKGSGLPKTFY